MINNVEIIIRERGKIVARRESHNIWTVAGKTWLGNLVSYASYSPDTWGDDNRLRYAGLGIGGYRQTDPRVSLAPLSVAYPGTNEQNNWDDTTTTLERPVLFSGSDYYTQFTAVTLVSTYHIRFTFYAGVNDINLTGTFLVVPISEVGLFLNGIDTTNPAESAMAYDVFDEVIKNSTQDLTMYWNLRL